MTISGVSIARDVTGVSPKNVSPHLFEAALDAIVPAPLLSGRFELKEVVGRGSTSVVYYAVDRAQAADFAVAVKMMTAEGDQRAEIIKLARREAACLRALSHPNIVQIFDAGEDGVYRFLALELFAGQTLMHRLREAPGRRLPLGLTLSIIGEIAAALSHTHASGFIHGDIKPSNVFIEAGGRVKLFDFGAARALGSRDAKGAEQGCLDEASALTPLFASFEALTGGPPSASDDVYSLAVLTYVALTGTHPYDGCSAIEAFEQGMGMPRRPADLRRSAWRALQKGLALRREKRTPTIDAFARGLTRTALIDRLFWKPVARLQTSRSNENRNPLITA